MREEEEENIKQKTKNQILYSTFFINNFILLIFFNQREGEI